MEILRGLKKLGSEAGGENRRPVHDTVHRDHLRERLAGTAHPLGDAPCDLLIDLIVNVRLFLLREPSRGTREFYRVRVDITKRLIAEPGTTGDVAEIFPSGM